MRWIFIKNKYNTFHLEESTNISVQNEKWALTPNCEDCSDWPERLSPAFEEGDVNWRRVEVYKLEDENFEDEHVFIFGLSAMHFWQETGEQMYLYIYIFIYS